ncbi:DoxX family protein, partial [Listeria monocytogenes]
DKGGEGFEYHILAVSMALSLVITGGGSYSIDRPIAHQLL